MCVCSLAGAQAEKNIVKYEFWFDEDASTQKVVDVAPAKVLNLNISLPPSDSREGIHTCQIRFQDSEGAWSSVSSSQFYVPKRLVGEGKITGYEYWFDNDMSKKTSESVTPSDSIVLLKSIAASTLSEGVHMFQIHFRDERGAWSSVSSSQFSQMLLSMTQNERATRAEISDVANAVLDGTDVVMLSEESAVGEDPINVVDTMHNIIAKTEGIYNYDKQYEMPYLDEFDVIQATVTKLADDLKANGILAITSSGKSALKMSRYRPRTPIFTFTHKKKVLNSLTAVWGVEPIGTIKEAQASKMFQKMLVALDERGLLNKNGLYVATVGYPVGMPGSTNTIKILTPSEIEYYLNFKDKKAK